MKKHLILLIAAATLFTACQTPEKKLEQAEKAEYNWQTKDYMTVKGVYSSTSPDIPSYAPKLEDNELFFDVEEYTSEADLKKFLEKEGWPFALFEGKRPVVLIMPNNALTTMYRPDINKIGFTIKLSAIQAKYLKGRHIYSVGKRSEGISKQKDWQFPPDETIYLITSADADSILGDWVQPVPNLPARRRGIILQKDGAASSINPEYWAKKIIIQPKAPVPPPQPQEQNPNPESAPEAQNAAAPQQPELPPTQAAAPPAQQPAQPAREIKVTTKYEKWELQGNYLVLSGKYISKEMVKVEVPVKQPKPKISPDDEEEEIYKGKILFTSRPQEPVKTEIKEEMQEKEYDFTEVYEIRDNPTLRELTLVTDDGKELQFYRKE